MVSCRPMSDGDRSGPPTVTLSPGQQPIVPSLIQLLVLSGPDRGQRLTLVRGTYHVGKDPTCSLVLSDSAVSRRHLELEVRNEGVLVRDLGSKNGSFYRGATFAEVTVGIGAVLRIGTTELKLASQRDEQRLLPSDSTRFGGLVGCSLVMREVFALLE